MRPALFYRMSSAAPWEQVKLPVENGCPVSIIHFVDDNRGIVVAGKAILFTRDGGLHWTRSAAKGFSRPANLQFSRDEASIGCEDGEILRSPDGGEHWDVATKAGTISSGPAGFGTWGYVYFHRSDGRVYPRCRGKFWLENH